MRVYMDNNATTQLHPGVAEEMTASLDLYGNPSSMHSFGRETRARVEEARERVAGFLDADTSSVIFTGGGSESNNTVLKLVTCSDATCVHCPASRKQIITTVIEHPSVLNTVEKLESRGVPAKYMAVGVEGKIDLTRLEEEVSDQTALVSVIMANNEIGTVQNIKAISDIAHRHGALVHTDAVQAVGKLPVSIADLGVDFLSFSAHKLYGPKGVGVLYARQGAPFCTFIHGGHQEEGRRAGTLNTLGIIGLGKAVELASHEMDEREERVGGLRDMLRVGIVDSIPDIHVNGHPEDTLAGTLNVSFRGCEGEAILLYLDLEGIAVSTGSACASGSLDPSHVLLATGIDAELAHGSIRFSLGAFNTEAEVTYVLDTLPGIIGRIRSMSTIYAKTGETA